jgi:hypothetical protein
MDSIISSVKSTPSHCALNMPPVRILLAQSEDAPAVAAFNDRLRAAGAGGLRLSLNRPFAEYVLGPDCPVRVEHHFVWVDGTLRGGVVLKRMPFWIAGQGLVEVAFMSYPVSEGVVNREFGFLGLTILKHVVRTHPRVYGLGAGGLDQPVARLMVAAGWQARPVPFRFAVFRARPFLRQIEYLRRRGRAWRWLADVAAATGLGSLGLGLFRLAQALVGRRPRTGGGRAEPVSAWGEWADALWLNAREGYAMIGDRSAATLGGLYPDGHPHLRRLRVMAADGSTAGWAVMVVARQRESRFFGNLCLGTLVDCLAAPGREGLVVSHALVEMRRLGADLAVTNHSAMDVLRACDRAGMLRGPSNYFLFLAPALRAQTAHSEAAGHSLYLTRGDGDGPINLW